MSRPKDKAAAAAAPTSSGLVVPEKAARRITQAVQAVQTAQAHFMEQAALLKEALGAPDDYQFLPTETGLLLVPPPALPPAGGGREGAGKESDAEG
jgi:hypothetical protein